METITSILFVLTGLLLRLAIPILATVVLVFFLRKLDTRWQREAELLPKVTEKPECRKNQVGASEQPVKYDASSSQLPCWQANRLPNGYLNEDCLSCQVFTEAPIPALKPEPRRL
jgi:hypothetical protein